VWVFSNADSVELFLNHQSLGIKTMPRNGHLQWQVPYQAGELKAIGFKKGRILQSLVSTTDAASSIQFSPSVKEVSADGVGIVVVNVSVQDSKGREVPDANHLIRFSIKGDAKIIGVGNGDPSSHEADQCEAGKWQRSLFNGKCQLIVQVGKQPGNVIVEATGEGLQENKIDILAKKPSDE
jgi:beta-galactosidase